MALHEIKRPMTGRAIKQRRTKLLNFTSQAELTIDAKKIKELSAAGQHTIESA